MHVNPSIAYRRNGWDPDFVAGVSRRFQVSYLVTEISAACGLRIRRRTPCVRYAPRPHTTGWRRQAFCPLAELMACPPARLDSVPAELDCCQLEMCTSLVLFRIVLRRVFS